MRKGLYIFAMLLCICVAYSAHAQDDDLYFSPKKQKDIDKQNAKQKAYYDSIWAAQRTYQAAPTDDYKEKWSNFDSTDARGYRGIYDLSQKYESYQDSDERESYADRLRYDDPTYVVYARDPYSYDPWGGWGGYPGWGGGIGWSSGSWGWSIGWNYPYWGGWSPYWGWSYPYYPYYPYNPYCYGCHYPYNPVYYGTNQHRGSSMSGTGGNSGYTHRDNSAGSSQRGGSSLALPSTTYTRRTQGEYTRPSQRSSGGSNSGMVYSESGRSYESIQRERAASQNNSTWSNQQNASQQNYNNTRSSGSSSQGSGGGGGTTRSSGGGGHRGGSGR